MWLGGRRSSQRRAADAGTAVPAAKQRVVLSTLLVHANQVVSFDQLAEAVWGDVPPDGSRVTLRNYVKRLRQILGPTVGERIQTRDPGYQIDVDDSELDLLCFTKLFEAGGAAVRSGAWEQRRPLSGRHWTYGGAHRWPTSPRTPCGATRCPGWNSCAFRSWSGSVRRSCTLAATRTWCRGWECWSRSSPCGNGSTRS